MEYILIGMALVCIVALSKLWIEKTVERKYSNSTPTIVSQSIDLAPLQKQIDDVPNKVLTSIQNSTNTYKGALGELIGYINLRASYDRIIPLGSIVDFIAFNFPTEEKDGIISLIDVKTGPSARLSKEQKLVKQLVKDKKIEFVQFNISEVGVNNEYNRSTKSRK